MASRKIRTYQIKAKNLCTIFLCLTWTVNANSLKQNIIVINKICSWLPPFFKQNLLLFIQPRWQLRRTYFVGKDRVYRRHSVAMSSTRSLATLRYDRRCYFNVISKANMSQLNLPHISSRLSGTRFPDCQDARPLTSKHYSSYCKLPPSAECHWNSVLRLNSLNSDLPSSTIVLRNILKKIVPVR